MRLEGYVKPSNFAPFFTRLNHYYRLSGLVGYYAWLFDESVAVPSDYNVHPFGVGRNELIIGTLLLTSYEPAMS